MEDDNLVERLLAGVPHDGLHDDNSTELFDIVTANEDMADAAARITDLEAQLAARDAEIAAWLREAALEYTDRDRDDPYDVGWDFGAANALSEAANTIASGSYRKETP